METDYDRVERLIGDQQRKLGEHDPAYMVGEQLKLIASDPRCAELLAQDLAGKGMTIRDAEKKLKARADEIHREAKGSAVAIPPWEAEDILREFYGLPERTWGPGKDAGGPLIRPGVRTGAPSTHKGHNAPQGEGFTGERGKPKVIDLADFF